MKIQIIEQVSADSEPYRAIYKFDKEGRHISTGHRALSLREEEFYRLPEVNRVAVRRLWLISGLERGMKDDSDEELIER